MSSPIGELIRENLPALQIILPMITAPICVLARNRSAAWALSVVITWITFGISIVLLQTVRAHGVISYAMGGWESPWGIELRIEPLSAMVLLLVSGISAIVLLAARPSFEEEVPRDRHYLLYAAFLLCETGLLGMTTAGDAFNVFVFLEISSLATYTLIAMGPHRRALISAFRYLLMGTTGGTMILLGVGLLYMVTGTLNIEDLHARLQTVDADRTVLVALVCILVGTSIKLALLPLGAWLPNAYTFAPSVVTAFLAATATKVAFYVMARFVFRIFGAELVFERFHLDSVLMPMALIAMFLGAALAIFERDVKRLLAYSSLSQIGYMVLGLSFATVTGLTGGIVHLLNHAMMKSGLFLVMACAALKVGSTRVSALRGLGKRMPITAATFVAGGLAMIGVPLTAGFVSKWFLVKAALEQDLWFVALLVLLSSLLAVIYVWKVVEVFYFQEPPGGLERDEAPWSMLVPTLFLIGASIYFGIFTDHTVGIAEWAARELLGVGP